MKLLYVNTCVRQESRTKILADYLIKKLSAEVKEIYVPSLDLKPLDEPTLTTRSNWIAQKQFDDAIFDLAKDYANADIIVIAAPYWDLSFPTWLKLYVEYINIIGLVFNFSPQGEIIPLCKAKKLYYITTKGGYDSDDFGYNYIKSLAQNYHGIKEVELIKAEGLDIYGADTTAILAQTQVQIDKILLPQNKLKNS